MTEHARRGTRWGLLLLSVAVLFFLWAGYAEGWAWTGLSGDVTLWDWLSLALLPLVLATSTLWQVPPHWSARHVGLLTVGLAVAAVVVTAGYLVPWAWTGFTGNTAWDWIKLLLLPVLLPIFVVPRLVRASEKWMTSRP